MRRNHAPLRLSRDFQQELLSSLGALGSYQQTSKRHLAEVSPPPSSKRAKLAGPSEAGEALEEAIHQPKPQSFRPSLVTFLQDFVDPAPATISGPGSKDPLICEWLESVASNRAAFCRSDSDVVQRTEGILSISRDGSKSVPVMESTKDSDGFTVPDRPASALGSSSRFGGARPSSRTSSPASSYRKPLVEGNRYREDNLACNDIYIRTRNNPMPQNVSCLAQDMAKKRDSPEPTYEEIQADTRLEAIGFGYDEANLEDYYKQTLLFDDGSSPVTRMSKQIIDTQAVPNPNPDFKISRPMPDILYGYEEVLTFNSQRPQLATMRAEHVGTTGGLVYPFLAVEFKGDGRNSNGSFWVATNQCIGDSISCVYMVDKLNRRLQACQAAAGGEKEEQEVVEMVDSSAFSIALRGDVARLYISWKEGDLNFYLSQVRTFALAEPQHYIEFRRYVRNIIDWGRTKRLEAIRKALDTLLEEGRKQASKEAKSREAPPRSPDALSASSSKRGRRR